MNNLSSGTNVSRETFQAREKGKSLANASAMRQPRDTTERDPGATTAKSAKEDHGDCRQLEHGSAPQHKRRGRPQQSGRLRQDARDSKAATAAGHTRGGRPSAPGVRGGHPWRPRRRDVAHAQGGRGDGALCGQREGRRQVGLSRRSVCRRRPLRGGSITQEGAVTPRLPY